MKSYKIFGILLILTIVFSLSITGCSPETEVNAPENQEEDTSSDQEDEENNGLNKDDNQEDNDKDNEELEESENEKTDAEKDQTEENEALEESENSEETNDENENQDETREEVTEEVSESEDSSSDDTTNEEVSSESEEANQESESSKAEDDNQEETNMLKIEGNVSNPLSLSLEDLKSMEDLIYSGTFYTLNSFGTTEYTDFTGVKLWNLLKEKALISEEATGIQVVAVDGYSMEFTVEQIKRNDYIDETNQDLKLPVIIAWKENGEEYKPEDGPPYKLVIGQKEPGDVNKPQWVRDIDKIIVE